MAKFLACLCVWIFALVPIVISHETTCTPDSYVLDLLENRYGIKIRVTSLTLSYDFDEINVNIFSDYRVTLFVNTTHVNFSGFVEYLNENDNLNVNLKYNTKPIVVQRTMKIIKDEMETSCKMVSSKNNNLKFGLSQDIETAIIQLTEYCIEVDVCEEFDYIVNNDFLNNEINNLSTDSNLTQEVKTTIQRNTNVDPEDVKELSSCGRDVLSSIQNPQLTVNAMVDFGSLVFLHNFPMIVNGTANLPEIIANFSTGSSFWKVTGDFLAANGTFEDVSTLERIGNIVFGHDKQKFTVGATYRLEKAKVSFDRYELRYGKIKLDGHLGVNIDGITLNLQVAFDFNEAPCRIYLTSFNLKELGEIDVDFTGLGFLNGATKKLIAWVIRKKLFDGARDAISQQLDNLDCEKFRPKTPDLARLYTAN